MTKPSKGKRVMHLLSKLFMVRQMFIESIIEIEYLATDKMIADYLTKPIYLDDYHTIVANLLGLCEVILP